MAASLAGARRLGKGANRPKGGPELKRKSVALGPLYGPRPVVWPSARLEKLARLRMAEGTRNSRAVHGPPPGSAELYPGPGTRNSRAVHGPRCQLCAGRRTPRYADGRSEENDFALLQTELAPTVQWKIFRSTPPCQHGGLDVRGVPLILATLAHGT